MSSEESGQGGLRDREALDDLSIREMYSVATLYEKVEMTVIIFAILGMMLVVTIVPDELHDQLEEEVRDMRNIVDWYVSSLRAAVGVIRRG